MKDPFLISTYLPETNGLKYELSYEDKRAILEDVIKSLGDSEFVRQIVKDLLIKNSELSEIL